MTWTECGYKMWDVTCDGCGAEGPDPGAPGWSMQAGALDDAGWERTVADGVDHDWCPGCWARKVEEARCVTG